MSFDADLFLSTQVDAKLDTRRLPIPPGDYIAQITAIKGREFESRKNPGENMLVLSVTWQIDDANGAIKQATGLENPTVVQDVFIDRTPSGGLATGTGQNVQLGKLREAVGQNIPGQPWAPLMLVGTVARVAVVNEPDKNNPENVYDRVKSVAKA